MKFIHRANREELMHARSDKKMHKLAVLWLTERDFYLKVYCRLPIHSKLFDVFFNYPMIYLLFDV